MKSKQPKKLTLLVLLFATLLTGCNQERAIEHSEKFLLEAGYTEPSYIGLGVVTFNCPKNYIRADKFNAVAPTGKLKAVVVCSGFGERTMIVQR